MVENPGISQKKIWLDHLYYSIGQQSHNFRLCSTWLDSKGGIHFSKWIPYLDAQGDEAFIARCNQREQLLCEVILDLDQGTYQDYRKLCYQLKKDNVDFFAYSTKAGRARHIHTIWPRLVGLPKWKREAVREKILKKYGCDLAFKTDSHLVPIENCPHWKTGELKTLVYKNGGDYDF